MEGYRKFPRIQLELKVDYRISGRQMPRQGSMTQVVGGGGLMIKTRSHLPAGTRVEMNLYHDSFVIPFEAEVVWIDPDRDLGTKEYRCGCQYVSSSNNGLMHLQYLIQHRTSGDPVPPQAS